MIEAGFTLLFTGSIREPLRMLDAIDDLILNTKRGLIDGIVLSTWFGEIERFPRLFAELEKRGVVSVVSTEPVEFRASPDRYTARGHIYHQMFALKQGIDLGCGNSILLKSRPDLKLHDVSNLRRMLSCGDIKLIEPDIIKFSKLENRLRIEMPSPVYPFYIMDTHFVAKKHDVALMSDFNSGYDIVYNIHNAIPEIRFFHAPFRGIFPVIERMLCIPFLMLKFEMDGRHDQMLSVLLKDKFFLKGLFAYWHILENFFEIMGICHLETKTVDFMITALRDGFGGLIDEALLQEVARIGSANPRDIMARIADPSYSSDDEYSNCAEKLARIALPIQPRAVVYTQKLPIGRSVVNEGERASIYSIEATIPLMRGSPQARLRYFKELAEGLSLDCNFAYANLDGETHMHGVLNAKPSLVLWRSYHEAHIQVSIKHDNGDEEIKIVPIVSDIIWDYFFSSILQFKIDDKNLIIKYKISVDGEFIERSWSFVIDRRGMLSRSSDLTVEKRRVTKVFFDVGANDGQSSLHLAGNPDWIIYAFEPTPFLFMQLKEKAKNYDNYHVFPLAVSDKPGLLTFKVAGQGDWGTSSLLNFSSDIELTWHGRADLKVTEEIYVTVITLRDFVLQHEIDKIDVLHTDVQGVDLEALQGLGDKISIVQSGMMETARDHNVKLYRDQKYVLEDCTLFLYENNFVITELNYNDERGYVPSSAASLYSANEINICYQRRTCVKSY